MMSSPKDQEQGNRTEKQNHPIPVYDQLDHRHKQHSAHQEHNAVHSTPSRGIFAHVDVQHPSGRLDQGVLILALPLDLPTHPAILKIEESCKQKSIAEVKKVPQNLHS